MTVQYAWVPNRLKQGTYYARVIAKGTVRSDEIVRNIGERTLINDVDVRAVLDALDDEIVDQLLGGRRVILDDFVGFSISLELNNPDEATTPTGQLRLEDVKVRVDASSRPAMLRSMAGRLALEQTSTRIRIPQPEVIYDHLTKVNGSYSPLGVIDVRGHDLDLPEGFEDDISQGVFFIDTNETAFRSVVYTREGNKGITCVVPTGVNGPVDVEVRTNYGGSELRLGRIENIQQAA